MYAFSQHHQQIAQIRFYVTLFLVGTFFVVIAGIVLASPKAELLSTDGVIKRMESYTDTDGETQYQVFVSYTDDAGVRHEDIAYPAYDSSMKEGETVTLLLPLLQSRLIRFVLLRSKTTQSRRKNTISTGPAN